MTTRDGPRRLDRALPLLAGALGSVGAIVLACAIEARDQVVDRALLRSQSAAARLCLEQAIEPRLLALERMAKRMAQPPPAGDPAGIWRRDAESYLDDRLGMSAIAQVDSSGRVRDVVPRGRAPWIAAMTAGDAVDWRETAARARAASAARLSAAFPLDDGQPGLVIVAPLGEHGDLLLGVCHLHDFLDPVLQGVLGTGIGVSLTQDGRTLVEHGAPGDGGAQRSVPLTLRGSTWELNLWPTAALAPGDGLLLSWLVLGSGVLASLLLAGALRTLLHARAQTGSSERAAQELTARLARAAFAERTLHECERRLDLALWGGELGLYDWDLATDAVVYDQGLLEMLGYSREQFPARIDTWEALVHPDDIGDVMWRLEAHLTDSCGSFEVEHRLLAQDGRWRWTLHRARVVERDADGAALRLIGVIQDVDRRRRAERQLRQANELLERRVAERSVELERARREADSLERQLAQLQRLEAVGRLAGGVAHDFNNMLSVINGYSELALQRLDEDHPARRAVLRIKAAGDKSAALTGKLLAFSRKQLLAPRVIDLADLLDDLQSYLDRLIGEKVELEFSRSAPLGRVEVDPTQLEQAILNLAVNARDAMPSGGRLTVGMCDVDLGPEDARRLDLPPGPYAQIMVADTGCGMDADTVAQIFEPFFTTKAPGEGTGLGLPSVHGFVRQSGGAIEVDSRVGEGSSFRIYLPRVEASCPPSSGLLDVRLGGQETILLAEDEEMVRELARETLGELGYRVVPARDGREALRVLQGDEKVHLLISDVVMPGMSGMELADEVRRSQPELPVMLVSGYTRNVAETSERLQQGQVVLSKPVPPSLLARVTRLMLDGRIEDARELARGSRPVAAQP